MSDELPDSPSSPNDLAAPNDLTAPDYLQVPENLSPVVGLTRRDAVLSELRNAILTGQFKPGERLGEAKLAKSWGVARPTLREAIYQLIHEGLLVQNDHRGVSVAEVDEAMIMDIAIVRVALESIAAQAVASDPTGDAQAAVQRAWAEYDAAAASADPIREHAAHLEFHRTVWDAAGNTMLQRIWPILFSAIHLAVSADEAARGPEHLDRSRRQHRELAEAIQHNRQPEIAATIREHIEVSAVELVQLIRERSAKIPD